MALTWQTTPEAALADTALAQSAAIYAIIAALAKEYAPVIQAYMNASIPWHANGLPDTIDPEEPNDMLCWVEEVVNEVVMLHLSHDDMTNPEPTLEQELSYVPPAFDYFGPLILAEARTRLGIS